ncbi:TcfC E-set like domain-containing protein [Vibrio alfacsensis]|uniref:TcfC E-set like domain-containing protein n=1 Tax=Vibrio alfacsensis TaxID=1074311 RepID=UPI00406990B9
MRVSAFCIASCLLLPAPAFADYPLEFADFFTEQRDSVEITIAGSQRRSSIDANISYDTFRLTSDEKLNQQLYQFLLQQNLTVAAAKQIIDNLSAGIPANPGCQGALQTCVPENKPGQAEYVFDFDSRRLRLFVSPEMLESSSEQREYYSALRQNNALINWSNLYAYADGDGHSNFTFSNDAVLGLPLGFFAFDSQYQSSDNEFDIYQALYDVEVGDVRALLGYQGQTSSKINTTDTLAYGADYNGIGLTIASSQNLLKGRQQAQQRILFYAPQSAQLEIYQGSRLLVNRVVSEGQQSVGYDQLPSGSYTVTIILRTGEQEIFREQRQVVNSSQFSLAVNDWDYMVNAGMLEELEHQQSDSLNIDSADRSYARGALSFRPLEQALLSLGSTVNGDDLLLQTAGNLAYGDKLSGQYNLGYFRSGAEHYSAQVSFSPLTVPLTASARRFDTGESESSLATMLYGESSFTEMGLGVSGPLLGGTGFVNYFKYQSEYDGQISESDNISASWSRNWLSGSLSISTTYSQYGHDQYDLNTSIMWSSRVNDSLSGQLAAHFDKQGFAYNRNSMTYQTQHENVSSYSTAAIKLAGDGAAEAELSSSINGHTDYVGYSGYGYLNDQGSGSVSGSLSGTQILSRHGAAMTHERGVSFVHIAPQYPNSSGRRDNADNSNESNNSHDRIAIKYNMLRDGQFSYRDELIGDSQLLDLTPYSHIEFTLDAEADNVDIENKEYRHFVMPGSYYQLNSKVTPLESRLFVLNDMFDQPVSSARCIGEGCVSIEPVSEDGVFRVNYRQGAPFKIVSSQRLCVQNTALKSASYAQAYCLPGLDESQDRLAWSNQLELNNKAGEGTLLYLGKYELNEESSRIVSHLIKVGLALKTVEIDKTIYVYVKFQDYFTQAQRTLLESLNAYVILDVINIEHLFSVR